MGGIALFGAGGVGDDVDVFMAGGGDDLEFAFIATGALIIDPSILGAGGGSGLNLGPVMA